MNRRSYRDLMQQPAYLLLDARKRIVASVRAATAVEAVDIFRQHGLKGRYVRKVKESQ